MNTLAMVRPLNKLSNTAFTAIDQNSNEQDMKWFVAKIIFKIYSEGARASQFDEHLRLISAAGFDEAFLKARILGISEEETLLTDRNKTLKWEFINVSEIIPMNKLEDGIELYSRIHETEEARTYINFIHQKAIAIRLNECAY